MSIADIVSGASDYPLKEKALYVPDLDRVAPVVEEHLRIHFKHAQVGVEHLRTGSSQVKKSFQNS